MSHEPDPYSLHQQLRNDYDDFFHTTSYLIFLLILAIYALYFIVNLTISVVDTLSKHPSDSHFSLLSNSTTPPSSYRLYSHDISVAMSFASLDMTSYINVHGVFAVLTVCMALLQKYGVQRKAKATWMSTKRSSSFWPWNTNRFWCIHKWLGYLTMCCTLIFSCLGWISSDYSSWTHFSSWFKYWLFFPYIVIIPFVLLPLKWCSARKRIFYHRLFGNLFIKMLFLGPLSRIIIAAFQKINVYKSVATLMGNTQMMEALSVAHMNEYNYYYAVCSMTVINMPWQIYDMYAMYKFVRCTPQHRTKTD